VQLIVNGSSLIILNIGAKFIAKPVRHSKAF